MKVVVKVLIIMGVALLNIITLGRFSKMTMKSTTTAGGVSASSSDAAEKLTPSQQVSSLVSSIDTMVKDDIKEDAAYEAKISDLQGWIETKKSISVADVAYFIGQNRSSSPEGDWVLAEKLINKFIK